MLQRATRLRELPPYFLMELVRKHRQMQAEGHDVIDFALGDPDQPTPAYIVERIRREALVAENHSYPKPGEGIPEFRQAFADFYQRRFGVSIDPVTQVCALVGSKEGIGHLIWSVLDPGDVCLLPDPGYPTYAIQTRLCGAEPYSMPLRQERNFLPDFDAIPAAVVSRARLMFLNYPHNPTGAVADHAFLERAVAFCRRHNIILAFDNAYSEITFDGYIAPSIFEIPGAAEVAVEFWSLSKPFNMAGWRVAALVGNADVVASVRILRSHVHTGMNWAIQYGAVTALTENPHLFTAAMCDIYRRRRDLLTAGLRAAGLAPPVVRGSFYVWLPVPGGASAAAWAERLLYDAGVMVAPGASYGDHGEGYVRMALTVPEERIEVAVQRMKRAL